MNFFIVGKSFLLFLSKVLILGGDCLFVCLLAIPFSTHLLSPFVYLALFPLHLPTLSPSWSHFLVALVSLLIAVITYLKVRCKEGLILAHSLRRCSPQKVRWLVTWGPQKRCSPWKVRWLVSHVGPTEQVPSTEGEVASQSCGAHRTGAVHGRWGGSSHGAHSQKAGRGACPLMLLLFSPFYSVRKLSPQSHAIYTEGKLLTPQFTQLQNSQEDMLRFVYQEIPDPSKLTTFISTSTIFTPTLNDL